MTLRKIGLTTEDKIDDQEEKVSDSTMVLYIYFCFIRFLSCVSFFKVLCKYFALSFRFDFLGKTLLIITNILTLKVK